ncbi:unnamed protein product [Rotaria sp. Silwood1]|nr:unnamed protein product [Rotaria sp. Silwood1]CAF1648017.1 unnamed protein product [Rotaria sp. Silwood1]
MLMPPKNKKIMSVHIKLLRLEKKQYEPHVPTPEVLPYRRCRLKQLCFQRIKDNLLLEEEFIKNQQSLKAQEDRHDEER